MRIILLIAILLMATTAYANQCIVNTITDVVREWTYGTYCEKPPLNPNEELRDFVGIKYVQGKVLEYKNGSIVATANDLPEVNIEKDRLMDLLDDTDVKNKIKALTP